MADDESPDDGRTVFMPPGSLTPGAAPSESLAVDTAAEDAWFGGEQVAAPADLNDEPTHVRPEGESVGWAAPPVLPAVPDASSSPPEAYQPPPRPLALSPR